MSQSLNQQATLPHSLLEQATQVHAAMTEHVATLQIQAKAAAMADAVNQRVEPVLGGSPFNTATSPQTISQVETDLLTMVRQKLNRVATDFGIPYSEIRDFFVSKL